MSKENKVPDCVYPFLHGCYTCEHNEVPGTYDGGCKLYFERLRRESETCQHDGTSSTLTSNENA